MRFCFVVSVLIIVLGCGNKDGAAKVKAEDFSSKSSARSELDVFETAGYWSQLNEVLTPGNKTNHTTTLSYAYWGLKGHNLLVEMEIKSGQNKKYNLVVKNYNELASENPYQCVWFQDDGLVQGFAGSWDANTAELQWHLSYPKDAQDIRFNMTESFPKPSEKSFSYKILEKEQLVSQGSSKGRYIGDTLGSSTAIAVPIPEMARLGRAGVWEESQEINHPNGTVKLSGQSRMRWTRSGRALINEGVIFTKGKPDYYMWIKTWDAVARHYGYVYFFEDGPIHYFIGDWKPEEEAIVWRCMQPDSAILIKESLKQSGRRDWTFTVNMPALTCRPCSQPTVNATKTWWIIGRMRVS